MVYSTLLKNFSNNNQMNNLLTANFQALDAKNEARRFSKVRFSAIMFVDPAVADWENLVKGVKPGIEVIILDRGRDGIKQISEVLESRTNITSVHIVSHGSPGSLKLGNAHLNRDNLDKYGSLLQQWRRAFTDDADLLIYACNVAFEPNPIQGCQETGQGQGREVGFIQRIALLAGANVAASAKLIGCAELGGEWELECAIGQINTPLAFEPAVMANYQDLLADAIARVSVDSNGNQGDGDPGAYFNLSISGDGRYVVFASAASNLVKNDPNLASDIFIRDTLNSTTTPISTNSNGNSLYPSISADGRYVSFSSAATNLVNGDTNGQVDIFLRDTVKNTTSRISLDSNGNQGNGESGLSSISADGRYVAFTSNASNLVTGDTNGEYDIFVRDTVNSTTALISVDSNGSQANRSSYIPSISADGRYVAFESNASNLVTGDTNNSSDIFLRDTVTKTTTRISVDSNGQQGKEKRPSQYASISSDGRYVAFASEDNLASNGNNNFRGRYIYVRDTLRSTTTFLSPLGLNAIDTNNIGPSISADGRYVAFYSLYSPIESGRPGNALDVFVWDTVNNTTKHVSVDSNGNRGNQLSKPASISGDGRYVAFYSLATNLVTGDTNNAMDVFVRDISAPIPIPTPTPATTPTPAVTTPTPAVTTPTPAATTPTPAATTPTPAPAPAPTTGTSPGPTPTPAGAGTGAPPLQTPTPTPAPTPAPAPTPTPATTPTLGTTPTPTLGTTPEPCICDRIVVRVPSVTFTLFGGNGDDTITGTNLDNAIAGEAGNDIIIGRQGNDSIAGGVSSNIPVGGVFSNTAAGQIVDRDLLFGNEGNDYLNGGADDDTIYGGKNDDLVVGGAGNDLVRGDKGSDTASGGDGNDTVRGGKGNDTVFGDAGDDRIFGDNGDDLLCGGDGNDTLFGETDRLALTGDLGLNDSLCGGSGDDWLIGGEGSDTLKGDLGSDRFVLSSFSTDTVIDFEDNRDLLVLTDGLTFAQLAITQKNNSAFIAIANTGKIFAILDRVSAANITVADFTLI